MNQGSRKAIIAALVANLGIAILKFGAYLITGAASMLAEAGHSVADTGNQALLVLGGVRAQKDPTPEHPFGYGRERYFWAFVVSMVLFSLGSLFAVYEGVQKLAHPHELARPEVAIGVLILGIVLEGWSFRTAIREANRVRGEGQDWWQFVRHSKSPELPVVLLEDLGALIGLVLALVGIGLAMGTGDPRWDAFGSIGIGALLGVIAIVLAIEMKSLLIGESASPHVGQTIRESIERSPGVRRLIHMRTLHIGPDELLVGAKVEFDAVLGFAEVAVAIDRIEANVRQSVAQARVIYIEPDLMRS